MSDPYQTQLASRRKKADRCAEWSRHVLRAAVGSYIADILYLPKVWSFFWVVLLGVAVWLQLRAIMWRMK